MWSSSLGVGRGAKTPYLKKCGTGFFAQHRILSAVNRVEFVSDRLSYIFLRGHWCNSIVLNVHSPSEEKSDDSKDGSYEELEQVSCNFPKYDTKILFGEFDAKVGRENIFKPRIWNQSLHQDSNYNAVRIVKFATAKNYLLRARCPHTETFISFFWPSPDG
jgi:hypothetical protein